MKIKKRHLERTMLGATGLLERDDCPAGLGATLGRVLRELAPKFAKFNVDWNDGIQRFGTEYEVDGPDGKVMEIQVRPEAANFAEWQAYADALLDEEVECPFTVKIADFRDMNGGGFVAMLGDLVEF